MPRYEIFTPLRNGGPEPVPAGEFITLDEDEARPLVDAGAIVLADDQDAPVPAPAPSATPAAPAVAPAPNAAPKSSSKPKAAPKPKATPKPKAAAKSQPAAQA